MKTLVLTLALLALVVSASNVMAGGGGYGAAFQEQWKAAQAQQKAIDANLARIDRDAARGMSSDTSAGVSTYEWGVAAGRGSGAASPPSRQRFR